MTARAVRKVFAALAILAFAEPAAAQSYSWGNVVASFPRGGDERSLGITESAADALPAGPAAIGTTAKGSVLILDQVNSRIVRVGPDGLLLTLLSAEFLGQANDMFRSGRKIYVWAGGPRYAGTLRPDDASLEVEARVESTGVGDEAAMSAFASHGAVLPKAIDLPPGAFESTGPLNSRPSAPSAPSLLLSADGGIFELAIRIVSRQVADIRISRDTRKAVPVLLQVRTNHELGSVTHLATDVIDRTYFRVEELIPAEGQPRVKVWVFRFSADGMPDGGYDVPDEMLEIVPNRYLTVSDQGAVYFLGSRQQATFIARLRHIDGKSWPDHMSAREPLIAMPERESSNRRPMPEATPPNIAPTTRRAILAEAERFRTLKWVLGERNYAANRNSVCDPLNGRTWKRPSSLSGKVGEMIESVPYNWGGYMSTEQFVKRIASNAVAGNVCTCRSTDCVDREAAGVDCSGFVSQVWSIERRTTATLFQVAETVHSYDQLLPGDILNKPNNHVRLFIGPSPSGNGAIRAYESSLDCSGVCIRDFSRKQLEGYIGARRRNLAP